MNKLEPVPATATVTEANTVSRRKGGLEGTRPRDTRDSPAGFPSELFTGAEAKRPLAGASGVTRAQFLDIFVAVFLPMLMAAVDQTLLATATPTIAADLGNLRDSSWIAVAYLLAAATIVPVYGRLGDQRGKRDMLMWALGAFTIGSIACGAAQTMPQLIAARVVQGLGGGGLMMLSHALIGELIPPVERVKFQGYFALMFATASMGGPVIGGVVVTHVSWRWLFAANIPLAVFAAWRLCKLPPGEKHPRKDGGTDIPGHIFFAVGCVSLLFWLTSGGHRFEWASPVSVGLAATAVACLAALVWHERRHPSPFFPIELFGIRTIRLSSILVLIFAACMFSVIFFLPIYLQLGHRMSAQASGLLLLPVTAGQVIAAMAAARIMRKSGKGHAIPVVGMAFTSIGLLLLGLLPPSLPLIAGLGFFTGLGLGSVMPVNQVVVQTVAGRTKLAAASATTSLARSTGGAAGAALFGALVFAMIPNVDRHSILQQADTLDLHQVVTAFHRAFLVASVVAALGAFTAWRIPKMTLWETKG